MIDVFSKFIEMIETTIDLDRVSSHEYKIKADYDEDLQSREKRNFFAFFYWIRDIFLPLFKNAEKNNSKSNRKCTTIWIRFVRSWTDICRQRRIVIRKNRTATHRKKLFVCVTIRSKAVGFTESIGKKAPLYRNNCITSQLKWRKRKASFS